MDIIQQIHQELKKNIDEKYKNGSVRFYKGGIKLSKSYGVRTPLVRKLAIKYLGEIKNKEKQEIFELCEKLLSSKINEPITIAFQWALACKKQFEKSDFRVFENWLEEYVNEWGRCDDLCAGPLGELVFQFPELLPKVFAWTKSKNMWFRRASAVCLITSLRKGKCLDQAFKTADTLIADKEDLVQKGYGWMLKEASKKFQKEVFEYVMKNKDKMTRTALRYAIEKLPENMKRKAMS
ncbi:MAG: DNA alkylation repair protein [Candidatus Aenigmarchaeota archaeon]|nr:DNA alkylation repair protein [Candidatus Aenigmarchaeota archaeon]